MPVIVPEQISGQHREGLCCPKLISWPAHDGERNWVSQTVDSSNLLSLVDVG